MEQVIKEIYPNIKRNDYELIGPEGFILPLVWEEVIEPDSVITMRMREPPTSSSSEPTLPPPPADTQVAPAELGPPPITTPLESQLFKKKKITFKDYTGRSYLLPFDQCQTWKVRILTSTLNNSRKSEANSFGNREWSKS
jgi:hypothetical protein